MYGLNVFLLLYAICSIAIAVAVWLSPLAMTKAAQMLQRRTAYLVDVRAAIAKVKQLHAQRTMTPQVHANLSTVKRVNGALVQVDEAMAPIPAIWK